MRGKRKAENKKSLSYDKRAVRRRRRRMRLPTEKMIISTTSRPGEKQKRTKKVPPKSITGRRLWLFRIIALTVVPALLFLLIELGLRVAGYGFPASAFIKHEVNNRASYCDNVKFGWRFFPRNTARESDPFVFPSDKPDNTYRIFVLGASAAKGEPDAAFCFGRFLEVMLRGKYPGVNFEIINTAMAAINSHVVLEIAKDCARHQPDLFIVYLGNNEVVGPYGAGSVFAPLSPYLPLIRAGIALKATKLGQLMTNLLELAGAGRNAPQVWRGLEMFLEKQVRAEEGHLETVYQHFEKNLKDICRIARKSRAKIIFCTVGSNLKDCPPFASLHRPSLTETEKTKCDKIYQQGVANETTGKYGEAVTCYLDAAEIDDSYADLQFRLGRCYWAMGKYEKARDKYIKARELDTLRFRADNRINETILTIASAKAAEGVYLVDAVKTFEKNSPHGIPGEELFFEHVHLNFSGTYLLAKTISEQVEEILPESVKINKTDKSSLLTEAKCAQYLAYTSWDQHTITNKILNSFIKKAPFTNQLYHKEMVNQMEQTVKALKDNLTTDALQETANLYRNAIQSDNKDWFLHYKYGKLLAEDFKDYQSAAQQYRLVQRYFPHSYTGYNAMASVLRGLKDYDGAIAQYLESIRRKPTHSEAHYYLGLLYQKRGQFDKAEEYYSKAMRLQPNGVSAYNNLGEILLKQGRVDEAMKVCRKGLLYAPDSPILRCNLGVLLQKQGRRDEAIREVRTALELDPNSARIRRVLQVILKGRN